MGHGMSAFHRGLASGRWGVRRPGLRGPPQGGALPGVGSRRSKTITSSPAGIAVLAVIGLFVAYPLAGIALLALGAAAAGAWYAGQQREARQRRERQLGYGLEDLDELSGTDFEAWVTAMLESGGIPAENIRDRGDFGVDVVADVDGVRVGIQVKRLSSSVGNSAVQEALAGSSYHDCTLAAVVTQSRFTSAARAQAERARVPVLLIGREEIHDLNPRIRAFAGG